MTVTFKRVLFCAASLALSAVGLRAQEAYPQKNVRFIVAFAPAGPADVFARLIGQALQEKWGKTVIVENRAGAGGNLGAATAARAEPDGYTVLVSTSAFAVNLTLYDKPGYALQDFQVAAIASTAPNILVGAPNLEANTLRGVIDASKTKNLSFGSAGVGTTPHLTGEIIFRMLAKADVRHVPFTGASQAVTATMAGQVPLALVVLPGAYEQVKAGLVKPIAIATAKRLADMPDVPTVNEAGFGDVVTENVVAFFMPAKTPKAVVEKFNADVTAIIGSGALDKAYAASGNTPLTWDQPRAQNYFAEEARKWGAVIRAAGLKVE